MENIIQVTFKFRYFMWNMPLIGAGLSKTKNDEKSILEFLVKLFKLNKDLIVSDIHIVIRDSGKETIPITEL